jgi:Tfp pilus assembly protein PilO
MRFHVSFAKTLRDFLHAKRRFSQLGRVPVRQALLTALAILGMAVGGYYMLHYQPNVKALWQMSDVEKYVEWHESLELGKKQQSVVEFSSRMKKIASLLDETHDVAQIMRQITEEAEKSDVEFLTVKPMDPREEGEYLTALVALAIRANYPAVVRFVRRLEESEYFINIVGINMQGDGEKTGMLRVVLTIEVCQKNQAAKKETAAGQV